MPLKQHNMKGLNFITPEGETVTVLDFDAANKIAYVHLFSGQHQWFTEAEYSQWKSANVAKVDYTYVPDIPAQMTEEQAESVEEVEKPKRKPKAKKEEE